MPLDKNKMALRGDSRAPHEIFPFGFRRRQDTWSYFEEKWHKYIDDTFQAWVQLRAGNGSGSDSDDEEDPLEIALGFKPDSRSQPVLPNFRYKDVGKNITLSIKDSLGGNRDVILALAKSPAQLYAEWIAAANQPYALRDRGDLDPTSAVCITDRLNVAALFPIPAEYPEGGRDSTWIYVVYVDSVFLTWQQQEVHPAAIVKVLARSREIATRDIPSGHVFAVARCYRRWAKKVKKGLKYKADWRSGVTCTLSPKLEMNTKLDNQPNFPRITAWVMETLGPHLGKTFQCEKFTELPDSALG